MTHEEKRVYLIKRLLAEDSRYQGVVIPNTQENQEDLLRSLMNVRPPMPVNEEFLKLQDEYLGEESEQRGVVDGRTLPPVQPGGRMVLWQGDITTLKADAIVNAANSALLGCFQPLHSCIDNLIHSRSGIQLRLACDRLMREQGHEEEVGKAKITPAFNLPARYVLHTVGPAVYGRVTERDCGLLASCYRSCLELAVENGCKSIAFCCISTGVFHFPNRKAAETAVTAVRDYLAGDCSIEKVIFNVYKDLDLELYRNLLQV